MPTRTRTIAAVLGALTLAVASCSSSTQSSQETTHVAVDHTRRRARRRSLKTFRWP